MWNTKGSFHFAVFSDFFTVSHSYKIWSLLLGTKTISLVTSSVFLVTPAWQKLILDWSAAVHPYCSLCHQRAKCRQPWQITYLHLDQTLSTGGPHSASSTSPAATLLHFHQSASSLSYPKQTTSLPTWIQFTSFQCAPIKGPHLSFFLPKVSRTKVSKLYWRSHSIGILFCLCLLHVFIIFQAKPKAFIFD
jgi:hypothetical protein